ncbi:MAG: protein kinase family protein [Rhodoferax sp.]
MSKSQEVVQVASFRDAYRRVYGALDRPSQCLEIAQQTYGVLRRLGSGTHAEVFLAQRVSPLPERVVIKLAKPHCADGAALQRSAAALDALQQSSAPGAGYFTQHLPQTVVQGTARGNFTAECPALVLRAPAGFWGSLEDVMQCYRARGRVVDARHAVWMWRRVLEVLAFVHDSGWVHQDLQPENLLVHPANHGVQIIGWSRAAQAMGTPALQGQDLAQVAWALRTLLCGGEDPTQTDLPRAVPTSMAQLLRQCENPAWCAQQGARGLDRALRDAAQEAFGPPRFIRFDPQP